MRKTTTTKKGRKATRKAFKGCQCGPVKVSKHTCIDALINVEDSKAWDEAMASKATCPACPAALREHGAKLAEVLARALPGLLVDVEVISEAEAARRMAEGGNMFRGFAIMAAKKAKSLARAVWHEILKALNALLNAPRRILLFGPPGTGNTTYAMSLNPEAERITLTPGQFPDALLGKFLLRDGSTIWVDGPATRAARKGVPLVLDEINMAGDELDSTLNAILDDSDICVLNLDNGEVVRPAKGYRVIGTMNGSPEQLKPSVLDRFDVVLKCNVPHDGLLQRLDSDAAKFIRNKMANDPDPDQWTPEISPRRMLAFCSLRAAGLGDEFAATICFGPGQDKTVLTALVDAARNETAKQPELLWTKQPGAMIESLRSEVAAHVAFDGELLHAGKSLTSKTAIKGHAQIAARYNGGKA
jgi:hypothetical protein